MMVYNKTKRGLEKAAGIVGVVLGSLAILNCVVCIATGIVYLVEYSWDTYYFLREGVALIVLGLVFLAVAICAIVYAARVIKSPVTENGVVNRKKYQVCNIVFSFLIGNWISGGLEIAAVCLKDMVDEKPQYVVEFAGAQVARADEAPVEKMSVEAKIAELKRLKDIGVIEETAYKKAIEKIIKELA